MKLHLSLIIAFITTLAKTLPCAMYGCLLCLPTYLPTQCVLCRPSYYLNNQRGCGRCLPNCANCTNSTNCLICDKNHFLKEYLCEYCGDQCSKCIDNIGCIQSPKYTFILNGTSHKCRNMVVSNSKVNDLRNQTKQSFLTTIYHQLIIQISNVFPTQNNVSLACPKCTYGFSLINQICILCRQPCSECNIDGCTSCINNTYLSNKRCIPCQHLCFNCVNASLCQSCQYRYYLSNSTCLRCGDYCNICINSTLCIECIESYYLFSNGCFPCNSYCNKCIKNNVCNRCQPGYQLSNSTCIRTCTINCLYCLTNRACMDCKPGYFLFLYLETYLQCNPCRLPCASCINQSSCTSCRQGYYLTHELACLACAAPCLGCIDASTCTSCKLGFFYSNSKCLPCVGNCGYCINNYICEACLENYYSANSSVCLPCQLQHCLLCVNNTVCSQCQNDYYVSRELTCLPCGEHCIHCLSLQGCIRCNDNTFSKNNTCYFSFPNCSTQLAIGYTLRNRKCLQIKFEDKPKSESKTNFKSNSKLRTSYLLIFVLAIVILLIKILLNKITQYFLVSPQQNRPNDARYVELPDQQQVEEHQLNGDVCSICLNTQGFFTISCRHAFHAVCIYEWLKDHNDCPICRVMVMGNITIRCKNCRQQGFRGKIGNIDALKEIAALKYFVCQNCSAPLQHI